MSVLTTTELELQVDTDLSDAALQSIIDGVERDINDYVGPPSAYVFERGPELLTVIRLPIDTSAIVSVVEFTDARSDPTKTTLASNDYELSSDGMDLRRLSSGTNPRSMWSWHVVLTVTPTADSARRKQCAIQLSRLEIVHTGYGSERAGDWNGTVLDIGKERGRILKRLDGALIT